MSQESKEDFGDEITGVHSAIKQFIEAKKENPTNKKAINGKS